MSHGAVLDSVPGMTLRDYFAAHAPDPLAASGGSPDPAWISMSVGIPMPASLSDAPAWGAFWLKADAILRYRYADAMIAERDRGGA